MGGSQTYGNYTITEESGWIVSSSVYYFSGPSSVADCWKSAAEVVGQLPGTGAHSQIHLGGHLES